MPSSLQSETSQGPTSPKKKFHRTEGKVSLAESVHSVRHLDISMARSNHSIDTSTLDDSHGSDEEIVEVDESETGWDEDQEKDDKKVNVGDNNVDDNDDSSYEEIESVVEEEFIDSDDEAEDEEVDDAGPSSSVPIANESNVVAVEPVKNNNVKQHVPKVSIPKTISSKQNVSEVGDDNQNLSWEKPEWTKSPVLKNSAKGKFLKEGGTVSAPITNIADVVAEKKDLSFKKPDWTKNTKLRSTGKADVLKSEGNLAKPITSLPHLGKEFDKDERTTIGWEKPDWTKKAVLKGTAKGDKLKSGGTLSRPIGGIKPVD